MNQKVSNVLTKFELEPDRDTILDQLLPQYARESYLRCYVEMPNSLSTQAGMTAMQTATDNAKNVINDLTIQYNRERSCHPIRKLLKLFGAST